MLSRCPKGALLQRRRNSLKFGLAQWEGSGIILTCALKRTVFLGSSTAEHPAVNRRVVGSNPTRGAICNVCEPVRFIIGRVRSFMRGQAGERRAGRPGRGEQPPSGDVEERGSHARCDLGKHGDHRAAERVRRAAFAAHRRGRGRGARAGGVFGRHALLRHGARLFEQRASRGAGLGGRARAGVRRHQDHGAHPRGVLGRP